MTGTLVSSWAFAPWRHESARCAAAWLSVHAPGPYAVVRADLSEVAERAHPLPAIDADIQLSVSLATGDGPPRSWPAVEAYAEAAHARIARWRAGGLTWRLGYSGPTGVVDHVLLALLREQGVVPRWTAHVADLPTHTEAGHLGVEVVTPGGLATASERILRAAGLPPPAGRSVAELALALIAARADDIVVGGQELAQTLLGMPAWAPHRRALAPRLRIWPPVALPAPAGAGTLGAPPLGAPSLGDSSLGAPSLGARPLRPQGGPGAPLRIGGWVPASRLAMLAPVVTAFGLLSPAERSALALTIATDAPAAVAALLRDAGVEEQVAVAATLDQTPDLALVVDRPPPDGFGWSPRPLPELGEWHDAGTPVILLAPQDSPLTQAPVAYHLPAEHVSAARALLGTLATGPSRAAG